MSGDGSEAARSGAALAVPLAASGGPADRFEFGPESRGPWRPDATHGGAPGALLTRAIESHGSGSGMRLASFQSVFLGPVMLGPVELESEVVKPGRSQMVVAARLTDGERTVVEARGVLLRSGDVELPAGAAEATPEDGGMPLPDDFPDFDKGHWHDDGQTAFHKTSNTIRVVDGGPEQVRPDGAAWFRLDVPVVPGETPTPAQRAVAAADFGNGLAHPVPFGEYVFVNCDLNVWLLREPEGEWVGLRSLTEVSANGSGLTRTALHDRRGRFGTAGQSLYVDVAG